MTLSRSSHRMFKAVGHCIYCGSDGQPEGLTREHIFPFSLGGTLTLPKSSCVVCARITRDFEQTCARGMFGKLRILFNLPTQHKKQRPTELPVEIVIGGNERIISVPIADCPSVPVGFPVFDKPGIMRGGKPGEPFRRASIKPVLPYIADNNERIARLFARFQEPINFRVRSRLSIGPFVRMLAKIAHSFAVAEFGADSFEYMLPDVILGKRADSFLIGCDEGFSILNGLEYKDVMHSLNFSKLEFVSKKEGAPEVILEQYLAAIIRLFKNLDTPTYYVIIGIPGPKVLEALNGPSLAVSEWRRPPLSAGR